MFGRTGNEQRQEASHYAEILKAIHTVDSSYPSLSNSDSDKRGSQRVKKHQYSGGERADGDRERHRKFHEDRYGSSR